MIPARRDACKQPAILSSPCCSLRPCWSSAWHASAPTDPSTERAGCAAAGRAGGLISSRMAARRSLVCLLALAGLLAGASAQSSELLGNLPAPGSLTTAIYFPEHPTKQFPAGDVITAVISAHNDNSKPYNLTAVVASLNSPMDFSMYIQNFSHSVYFKPLPAGEEMSLEYKFRLAPQVPTRDFSVAIHLIYEDVGGAASGYYSNVVFNGTVEVVEKPTLIDTEGLFMYAMIIGLFGGIGYWTFASAGDKLGLKKAAKKGRKADTKAAAFDEDEWVKGTAYDAQKRKKAAAATKAVKAS